MGIALPAIIEECEAGDIPLPEEIVEHLDRKEPWMGFYFEAYDDLQTCRAEGGRIPWTAMDRWAERHDLGDEFGLWFIRVMRAIDEAVVEVSRAQQGSQADNHQGAVA